MNYDFNEHKHRYAVWTAARAVQRSFTTTVNISAAIEATSLRSFAEAKKKMTVYEYDRQHKEWCSMIISTLGIINVTTSYGRAAKIIAIYLKTSVIMTSGGETEIEKIIHPPTDRILLTALSKQENLKDIKSTNWTTLGLEDYWLLVNKIRQIKPFDWTLEINWKPEKEIVTKSIPAR